MNTWMRPEDRMTQEGDMKALKLIFVLIAAALVSACSAPVDAPSFEGPRVSAKQSQTQAAETLNLSVNKITVDVPRSLIVTEANGYYPGGDIVWREDPQGDRYVQVQRILETGFATGAKTLAGSVAVDVDVELVRFHALTQKARYTVGGVHAISFWLQLRDPETGRALGDRRFVTADLKAFGGRRAIKAEARGETQKVRITRHLAQVLQNELTQPQGHQNAYLGVIQAINKI
jgi:hypothetical protein